MNQNQAPTKANLIEAKERYEFSQKGFELLDKKRNVLIREMMGLVSDARKIQEKISSIFEEAYEALQYTNITMGTESVEEISTSIPKDEAYEILLRSVMGVEIPEVKYSKQAIEPYYGFFRTNTALDRAVKKFRQVKYLLYDLAEIETSVYKLAMEIKKTQKRANALDKIQIPKYKALVYKIENALEEKEREDFFRLKKVKSKKSKS